jgi:hypothetical protein
METQSYAISVIESSTTILATTGSSGDSNIIQKILLTLLGLFFSALLIRFTPDKLSIESRELIRMLSYISSSLSSLLTWYSFAIEFTDARIVLR